ncbi:MAG TPA: carboxypeptidase-like regulatory domain-containing protein [Rhodothermales bacterium]|nr:carboxypeptidase-like regulatory domain-containing protein [Rhodothermales bacterium]
MQRFPIVILLMAWLVVTHPLLAQPTGTVTGTVTDSVSAAPMAGVSVVLEGTVRGTATSFDGGFRLEDVRAGSYTITASLIGYGRASMVMDVRDGETTRITIRLREQAVSLDEVVATAERFTVLTLLGFNLGVEIGQIIVIGVVFPVLFLIRRRSWYTPAVLRFGSACLIAIALFWFVERAFAPPVLVEAKGVVKDIIRPIHTARGLFT